MKKFVLFPLFLLLLTSCKENEINVGALSFDKYLPILEGKRVSVLSNQTGMVSAKTHLVDTLLSQGVNIVRSEEHTSELQSPDHFVCRLLLEKRKKAVFQALTQIYCRALFIGIWRDSWS